MKFVENLAFKSQSYSFRAPKNFLGKWFRAKESSADFRIFIDLSNLNNTHELWDSLQISLLFILLKLDKLLITLDRST